jgi:hypothetical protein
LPTEKAGSVAHMATICAWLWGTIAGTRRSVPRFGPSSMRSLQRHNQRPQPNAVTTFHRYINEIESLRGADRRADRLGLPLLP